MLDFLSYNRIEGGHKFFCVDDESLLKTLSEQNRDAKTVSYRTFQTYQLITTHYSHSIHSLLPKMALYSKLTSLCYLEELNSSKPSTNCRFMTGKRSSESVSINLEINKSILTRIPNFLFSRKISLCKEYVGEMAEAADF